MAALEDFDAFVERLRKIEAMVYVEAHRSAGTGVGKTLEDLLGIGENNVPDAAGSEEASPVLGPANDSGTRLRRRR